MKYNHHIFDIGAFNGLDGIVLAVKNSKMLVHAFEANPEMIKKIKENKIKIEKFIKKKITNYRINNFAVSNTNALLKFNIAANPTVSSLKKFSRNIKKTWPGYSETHCKFTNQITVKGITLKKYCNENNINRINYLHIDTQGNDLNVLKGLYDLISIVDKGVLEAAINKQKALYQKSNSVNEVKKFLKKNGYLIKKIESVDENISYEKNIYFQRIKYKNELKINTKYKLRFYNRIISDKLNIKDKFLNLLKIY